jgi:hypothetical protein
MVSYDNKFHAKNNYEKTSIVIPVIPNTYLASVKTPEEITNGDLQYSGNVSSII